MKKRQCGASGCYKLTDTFEEYYCAAHIGLKNSGLRNSVRKSTPLNYGPGWHCVRGSFLKHNPMCHDCGNEAKEVHHIKAYRDGGTHTADNLMALCKSCHTARTLSEHNSKGYIPRVTVDADGTIHRKDETGEVYSKTKVHKYRKQ